MEWPSTPMRIFLSCGASSACGNTGWRSWCQKGSGSDLAHLEVYIISWNAAIYVLPIYTNIYEYIWLYLTIYQYIQICMNMYEYVWIMCEYVWKKVGTIYLPLPAIDVWPCDCEKNILSLSQSWAAALETEGEERWPKRRIRRCQWFGCAGDAISVWAQEVCRSTWDPPQQPCWDCQDAW